MENNDGHPDRNTGHSANVELAESNEVDRRNSSAEKQLELVKGGDLSASIIEASAADTALIQHFAGRAEIFLDGDGYACIRPTDQRFYHAYRLKTKSGNNIVRRLFAQDGKRLTKHQLHDLNDELIAYAEMAGLARTVFLRVASGDESVEIDLGDADNKRVRITKEGVQVLTEGSQTIFRRTPFMGALPVPAETGDYDRLRRYLNLDAVPFMLLIAWVTYVLAHGKAPGTTFPILVFIGDQGSGKSFACKVVLRLIDPSVLEIQSFPKTERDLAIAVQGAHALAYDNLRGFPPAMADALCRVASGSTSATRALYTDSELVVHRMHCSLILNGIHAFIDQSDLAQRCVVLTVPPLDESARRDEHSLLRELEADLPTIFRGLLNLIADVLRVWPSAEVTHPERVWRFSKWLAAMELAYDAPVGTYQQAYSDALNAGMLDSLLEHPLAAAVLSLVSERQDGRWSGTPSQLLSALNDIVSHRTTYSREWPQNAIQLSKRLGPLQGSLSRQGVIIRIDRGRERRITISRQGGADNG
jgi:hypothetical protein